MKKSALIIGGFATVLWLIPIGSVISVLCGIVGIVLSTEAYQYKRKLAMTLSIVGLSLALFNLLTFNIPINIIYGLLF